MGKIKKYQNPSGPLSYTTAYNSMYPTPKFTDSGQLDWQSMATSTIGSLGSSLAQQGVAAIGKDTLKQGLGASVKAFGSGVGKGLSNIGSGLLSSASISGAAMSVANSLMGDKSEYSGDKGGLTKGLDTGWDVASDAVSVIPGVGTAIGLGMKGFSLANKALNKWTGSGTDGMTTTDALMGSTFGASLLGPISAINGWAGKKSNSMQMNDNYNKQKLQNVWGGYTGSEVADANASHKAGKKYGAFSSGARRSANRAIDAANNRRADLLDINANNEIANIRGQDMVSIQNAKYRQDLGGGLGATSIGRNGLKLPTYSDIKHIKSLHLQPRQEPKEEVKQFKAGGELNIIPEGALHAHLNNMEGAGQTITKKGIPVVDKQGHQQAEIECNEIIFRKEATDLIEKYYKDGSEEAALECGKLLVDEILHKTEDRTGLIEANKKGGVLKAADGSNLGSITASDMGIKPDLGLEDSLTNSMKVTTPDLDNLKTKADDVVKAQNQAKINKAATVSALGSAAIGIAKGVASGLAQDKANAQKREEAINKQIAHSKALEQKQLSAKLPNISISTTGYGKTPPVSSLPLNQVTPELEDGGLLYSQEEMDKYLQ